ncbi:MAG: signal peptidase I [Candidatus Sabulitectum sp.]|nr:signal peptidase I [Candidatus Sabulitectum sp.]
MVMVIISLTIAAFLIIAQWKLFVKAGEPGWAAIVPIYNAVVLMKIAGKPEWWVVLMFVPFANIVVLILMDIGLARNFGRSDAFAIGLIFLPYIFLAVLGFGDSRYSPVEQGFK